jgi:hypothetical protein
MDDDTLKTLSYPERFKTYGRFEIQHCRFTPVLVFESHEFIHLLEGDLGELVADLVNLKNYMRDCTGYGWGNTHQRVQNIFGDEFSFSIYPVEKRRGQTDYNLSVWNEGGSLNIFIGTIPVGVPERKQFCADLFKCLDRFSRGYVQCTHCHQEILYWESRERRFYAGIYCPDCWDKIYAKKEAQENYE